MAEKDRAQGMLGAADRWEKVIPKAVVAGSSAQAENVLADAIHDISCLWAACKGADDEITALRSRLEQAERERDEFKQLFNECQEARDAVGFVGSVPSCIHYLDQTVIESEKSESYAIARAEAAEASLAKAVEVIRPFNTDWADENGWTDHACQKDRIVDWFGPSDFCKAAEFIKGR